jgi:hypothetical protein
MLKTALLAGAVLALAGPAMAFGPSNQNTSSDGFDRSSLKGVTVVDVQCYPSIDYRRDHDPVTHTDIDLTFQPDGDFSIQSFVVHHSLMSGRVVNRDTQYAGSTWKKPGSLEWHWEGRQYDNPRLTMLATLVRTPRGEWQYQETIFKDGRFERALATMHCDRVNSDK